MAGLENFGELSVEEASQLLASGIELRSRPVLLERAIMEGRDDLVALLCGQHGFDPNTPTVHGLFPVHTAVEYYQPTILRYLCAQGANPDAQKSNGWSPLHVAVDVEADAAHQEDRPPSVMLLENLLGAGVDCALKDNEGLTALDLAIEWEHGAAIALLTPP